MEGKQSEAINTQGDPAATALSRGVWVIGDIRSPAQRRATRWLLRKASVLAVKRGLPLSLTLLGKGIERHLEEFRGEALAQVCLVEHPRLAVYRQETFTAVLERLVREYGPEIVLLLANDCGRELAPRLAARLRTGLCADCVDLDIEPGTGLLVQTVPAFGDHVYARIVTPGKRPQMATVRPAVLPEIRELAPGSGSPRILKLPFPGGLRRDRVKWLGAERQAASGEALEEARTVVCGGRGMGSGKGFQVLWTLARLLAAEVGGTRPAVQAHWIEEDCMVGQTGRAVAPELLLLFGISGATQFTASIQQSRYIVAVNKDPRAAVFCGADLGVVGDVRQVVPELIRRVQETLVNRYGRLAEEVYAEGGRPEGGAVGTRLRSLRQKRGYRIDEAARALEVSPLALERIEKDEEAPTVSFLLRAAQLFRVDPAPFLSQAEGARADRKREESYLKRTQSYSYRALTPGAERKHLRAFQVAIDPGRDHQMVEYRHEGEEFVLVVRGEVEVKVGEEIHTLREGDSLHFDGSIPHHLRNPSGEKADLVVVLYTP